MSEPRRIDRPECGFWAVRMTRGGVDVGAAIQWERTTFEPAHPTNLMDRSAIMTGRINGEIVTVEEVWTRRGREITEAYYRFLLADRAWARAHAPQDPAANPRQRPDITKVPPMMPPRRAPR